MTSRQDLKLSAKIYWNVNSLWYQLYW